MNFDVIKFCVEYSREKNKQERKTLDHSVVTNMTYMNEEHGNWLIDNKILLCTSLDGPEQVHDYNRPWTGGGAAYASVVKWMKWFNARYVELGHDPDLWHIDALTTTTQMSLSTGRRNCRRICESGTSQYSHSTAEPIRVRHQNLAAYRLHHGRMARLLRMGSSTTSWS